jgi:hypothetical protein
MLPAIRRAAQISFRKAPAELRAELVEEVVAASLVLFQRLVTRGKEQLAYPSALARFAVAQTRSGRRVGSRLRIGDVLSSYARRHKRFHLERLDQFDPAEDAWKEILVADHRATPADLAASRIDFGQWLGGMPGRLRKIAQCLATGESTSGAARRFGVTPARISQLRREFRRSWSAFHGDGPEAAEPLAA